MTRNELIQAVLNTVRATPAEDLPALLGELEAVKATAWMRLSAPLPAAERDELLSVERAGERLGTSTDYLYRNHRTLPFTRRMGRKLLFSSSGIAKFIDNNRR